MNSVEYIRERFTQLQLENSGSNLNTVRQKAFDAFTRMGIPVKHEEWKYTRISNLFNKEYQVADKSRINFSSKDSISLPDGCIFFAVSIIASKAANW